MYDLSTPRAHTLPQANIKRQRTSADLLRGLRPAFPLPRGRAWLDPRVGSLRLGQRLEHLGFTFARLDCLRHGDCRLVQLLP